MPIILNTNDFEPSTERQEILLDGPEIKKDERISKEIPTDVGINRYILKRSYVLFKNIVKYCSENKYNNLHLLARGLKYVPKVNKYFDKNWYEDIYMLDMRNIIYESLLSIKLLILFLMSSLLIILLGEKLFILLSINSSLIYEYSERIFFNSS